MSQVIQSDLELISLLQQMGSPRRHHRGRMGTEAAAVTGIVAVSGPPTPEAVLTADRPFAFVIVETTMNLPLFMGQVADPREA